MIRYLLSAFVFWAISAEHSYAQSSFPDQWIGEYEGDMIIATAGRPNDTIPLDFQLLEIIPDSVWSYVMNYHSTKWGELTKDYRYVRSKKGDDINFIFDEQNGIVMELTFMNDCFYGMYDVSEMIFINSFRKQGDGLFFELFAGPSSNPKISSAREGDEVYEAKSFKPTLVQSVVLRRKK